MAESKSNALEVTVTELSGKLKRTVEDTFGHVRVRGEISGFRGPHSSGHCYFSLKDEKARLEAVIWRGQAAKLKHMPEEGLEVIASGKLTTYPGSSKYQIVIDNLEPAGAGALMALLEERRKKLAAEGLFEDGRKQLLPYMPKIIGVVTSPTGAVIRDILHRIADRFPVHVIVWPVRVQGETSGMEVANGVHQLNNLPDGGPLLKPDLIIVARGGGSLEDLWGFNDEALVRSVANSMIPVISAVGHETDWTLVDHVADWRAPTPTAAAEKAVPVRAELDAYITDLGARLRGAISRLNDNRRNSVRSASRGLPAPDMLLALPRRRFDEASGRMDRELINRVQRVRDRFNQTGGRLSVRSLELRISRARETLHPFYTRHVNSLSNMLGQRKERFGQRAQRLRLQPIVERLANNRTALERNEKTIQSIVQNRFAQAHQQLDRNGRLLNTLSYKNTLERGFAVVRNDKGKLVSSATGVKAGQALSIDLKDGSLGAVVGSSIVSETRAAPVSKPAKSKSKKTDSGNQGQLF